MSIVMPSVGEYSLKPIEIKMDQMKKFLINNFDNNEPEDIQYYHTVHDEFKALLEKNEVNF